MALKDYIDEFEESKKIKILELTKRCCGSLEEFEEKFQKAKLISEILLKYCIFDEKTKKVIFAFNKEFLIYKVGELIKKLGKNLKELTDVENKIFVLLYEAFDQLKPTVITSRTLHLKLKKNSSDNYFNENADNIDIGRTEYNYHPISGNNVDQTLSNTKDKVIHKVITLIISLIVLFLLFYLLSGGNNS